MLGELLGLPGGRVRAVAELGDEPVTYLATVVVPPRAPLVPAPESTGPVGDVVISFVGAGPGAADLLTLRAADRLGRADVVIWASSLVLRGRARRSPRPPQCVHDSAGMTFEDVVGRLRRPPRRPHRAAALR